VVAVAGRPEEQCSLPKSRLKGESDEALNEKGDEMTVTGVPEIDRLLHLDDDDFDEPGTLGLHLGVLRRFALMAPREQPPTSPTDAVSER
jgi:hypothetical protein